MDVDIIVDCGSAPGHRLKTILLWLASGISLDRTLKKTKAKACDV